jgi:LPXTG-motif cell wall-anchored protein
MGGSRAGISVNDHRLVVVTDQGQRIGLVMDSQSMVPGEVAPGMPLRVEFLPMTDGRYYAKRGTSDPIVVRDIAAPTVERPRTLPQTANNQPLVALLGFLSIGAAAALTTRRRRHAS